ASTIACHAGSPGATTSRARMSASTTSLPRAASWRLTSDLPDAIPPVRPTRKYVGRASAAGVETELAAGDDHCRAADLDQVDSIARALDPGHEPARASSLGPLGVPNLLSEG